MTQGAHALRALGRDLAPATRSLARARAFTLVCVLSLGIGMGGFVALTMLGRMLTSPARGIDTDGLVEVLVLPLGPLRERAGEWAIEQWSYPDYQVLREADTGVAVTAWAMELSETGTPAPGDDEAPPRVATLYVSANYFDTFGVELARGPGFDPAIDDLPSAAPRVVLSHDYWQTRAGADPGIVGEAVTIDGVPHVVVGIAPEEFRGHFQVFQAPNSPLFVPLERHPRLRADPALRFDRATDWVRVHGRLAPGVDRARANARVSGVMTGLALEYPASNEFKAATVQPYFAVGGAVNRPDFRVRFGWMLGLAGVVLVLVCLNISGMMLVRGRLRARELGIREALGAGRRRLAQYLFLEALLLAMVGSASSALVLFGVPAAVTWWLGVPLPPEIDFDAVSLAISTGLCVVASLVFGLAPALRFSRPDVMPLLKEGSAGAGTGRGTIRVQRAAALVQVGVAVPFMVLSGVMLDRVRTADYGFDTAGLAAVRLPMAGEPGDPDDPAPAFLVQRVRESLEGTPGVRAVAVADGMPIDFDYRLFRVGRAGGAEFVSSQVTRVGDGFLDAVGATLLRGRPITAADGAAAARVAVISQPLAARLFPGVEPIGERVDIVQEDGTPEPFVVVGVTADFATSQLTTERPQVLLPLDDEATGPVWIVARGAAGDEPGLVAALENVVRDLDVEPVPHAAGIFRDVVTGSDLEQKSRQDLIAESAVVGVAGGLVLVLAALGILGVVGFMVTSRTREVAVRMALGATRPRVFGLMLSDVVRLVAPGVAGGVVLGALLIRAIDDVNGTPLTVGPDPLGVMEPLIYVAACAVAVGAALLAGLPAARRATTIQPMTVLRSE